MAALSDLPQRDTSRVQVVPCGYARAMAKDRLPLALLLIMLVAAIGIATVAILGAVEDCRPDGDCNISSSPSGLVLSR
jgi:hypothetical protein